jgi:hypothetical protein
MRTRRSRKQHDRVALCLYWTARLLEAADDGDGLMAATARDQLLELGLDVRPARTRRR